MTYIEYEKYSYLIQEPDAVQTLSYCWSHEQPLNMLKTIAYLKSHHIYDATNLTMCFKTKRSITLSIIIHLLHQNALLNIEKLSLISAKNQLEKILMLVSLLDFKSIDRNKLAYIVHQIIMYSDWFITPVIFNPFKHMEKQQINFFDFFTIFYLIETCKLSPNYKIKLIKSYLAKTHQAYENTEIILSAIPPTVSYAANKLYEHYQTQMRCPIICMRIRNQLYDAIRQLI